MKTKVAVLAERALERGVALYSASPCFFAPPQTCHLILGFTLPAEDRIEEGIAILAEELKLLMACG